MQESTTTTALSAFDYDLPAELIAQEPTARRGESRLMIVDRQRGFRSHERVGALAGHLRAGDLLVFNDVRVRRARIHGQSVSGGSVELLFLRETEPGVWDCLGKPAKRLRPGARVVLPAGRSAEVLSHRNGRVLVSLPLVGDAAAFFDEYGEVPLPPYIRRPGGPDERDRERYQTVFARRDGAVAAPTAGLHFTEALLEELRGVGVGLEWVTLQVGPATFLPVRGEDLGDVELEGELASIPPRTVEAIEATRRAGGRVIAVGTTTTRALESRAAAGDLEPGEFWADAFLQREGQFRVVDGLLTNFHLPRSTLLVLVSAFAGRDRVLAAYREAVRERYRFYSYGDAMLIL